MISTYLRDALKRSKMTAYEVAKRANVDPAAVRKFLSEERALTLGTADPIAEVLGMVLVSRGEEAQAPPPPDWEERLRDGIREGVRKEVARLLTEGFDECLRAKLSFLGDRPARPGSGP